MTILIAILALSFLIIVHEFGHFVVAKMSGIKVHEFSLFMGPKLLGVQKGETAYSLRLIPLGGYVKMEGEEEASNDARAFNRKPIPVRIAVIAAGPIMNLIVAIILVTIVFSYQGYNTTRLSFVEPGSPAYSAGLRQNDRLVGYDNKKIYHPFDFLLFSYASKGTPVNFTVLRGKETITRTVIPERLLAENSYKLLFSPKSAEPEGRDSNLVAEVSPGTPADKAGLKVNDRILKLNNTDVVNRKQIGDYLNKNKENPVVITVQRGGSTLTLKPVIPVLQKIPERYYTGIGGFESAKGTVIDAARQSLVYSYSTARSVFYSIAYLVERKVSMNEMMGPVGIVTTIGSVVQQSPTIMDKLTGLFNITALISINLGVFNLLPFPALDGSKIILLGVEGIRRKAIPPEKEALISMVGLALLVMLMLFATFNDLVRSFGGG